MKVLAVRRQDLLALGSAMAVLLALGMPQRATADDVSATAPGASKSKFVHASPPTSKEEGAVAKNWDGQEEFCGAGDKWIKISDMRVKYFKLDEKTATLAYLGDDKTAVYVWHDVAIPAAETPGVMNSISHVNWVLEVRPFMHIVEVEPPVQFIADAHGEYIPGYYDYVWRVFYAWKGVRVPLSQVPPASAEHRNAVLDTKAIKLREIKYIPTPRSWIDAMKEFRVPIVEPETLPANGA